VLFDIRTSDATGDEQAYFASGATGAPKGVCLDGEALLRVAESLYMVTCAGRIGRALGVLPLVELAQNTFATAALLAGGAVCLPPLYRIGVSMTSIDVVRFAHAFTNYDPPLPS
jgi:long-subunit acyl-CoA synthetase (AMP-forming)